LLSILGVIGEELIYFNFHYLLKPFHLLKPFCPNICSSKTSVLARPTRLQSPEDGILHRTVLFQRSLIFTMTVTSNAGAAQNLNIFKNTYIIN
jgi:hypothetical protein